MSAAPIAGDRLGLIGLGMMNLSISPQDAQR